MHSVITWPRVEFTLLEIYYTLWLHGQELKAHSLKYIALWDYMAKSCIQTLRKCIALCDYMAKSWSHTLRNVLHSVITWPRLVFLLLENILLHSVITRPTAVFRLLENILHSGITWPRVEVTLLGNSTFCDYMAKSCTHRRFKKIKIT